MYEPQQAKENKKKNNNAERSEKNKCPGIFHIHGRIAYHRNKSKHTFENKLKKIFHNLYPYLIKPYHLHILMLTRSVLIKLFTLSAQFPVSLVEKSFITRIGNFTPCVIEVVSNHSAGGIYNAHNVALEIFHIIVLRSIVNERICRTAFVIQEIHVIGSPCLTNQKLVRTILPTQKFFGWQALP